MNCFNIPVIGPTCIPELIVEVGGTAVDLSHPGFLAAGMLTLAIGLFVFRSPT